MNSAIRFLVLFTLLIFSSSSQSQAKNNKLKRALLYGGIAVGGAILFNELSKKNSPKHLRYNKRTKKRNTVVRQRNIAIQKSLNDLGYDTGTPDGIFGRRTKNAIIMYQTSINDTPSGKLTKHQTNLLLSKNNDSPAPKLRRTQQPRTKLLAGYTPRNSYRSDAQLNNAIQKCKDSYKYRGGGVAGTAVKIWDKAAKCQDIALQNYRQKSGVTQHQTRYTTGKNSADHFFGRPRSVSEFQQLYSDGENPYKVIAYIKKSYREGSLSGLSPSQTKWVKMIKFSLANQPLLNPRDGFNRLFSNGFAPAGMDMAKPGVVDAANGGENSRKNDRGREQIGTLYRGELFIYNGSGRYRSGRTSSFALPIDYADNYLKNFFLNKNVARTSKLESVAGDNLKFSDDVDMNNLVTRTVNRRADHSRIDSERTGNAVQNGLKALQSIRGQ